MSSLGASQVFSYVIAELPHRDHLDVKYVHLCRRLYVGTC
jgi:hypothetical protein